MSARRALSIGSASALFGLVSGVRQPAGRGSLNELAEFQNDIGLVE